MTVFTNNNSIHEGYINVFLSFITFHMYGFFLLLVSSCGLVGFMVFNATSNNISVISWRSVEETRVPGENPRPPANH